MLPVLTPFSQKTYAMRTVIQRVTRASVKVGGQTVGKIDCGFVILAGITHQDTPEDAQYIARKISGLRVFEDSNGKMNLSLHDINGSVLSISQFTLFADTRKGNRPSFVEAARPEQAKPLYEYFNQLLSEEYHIHVETGIFGAMMEVELLNDGPVTIIIDSKQAAD